MKKNKLFRSLVLGVAGLSLLSACSKDKTETPADNSGLPSNETWVIYNAQANWAGGVYALKDNKSREINLTGLPFFQVSSNMGDALRAKHFTE